MEEIFPLQCVVPFKSKETNRTDDKQGDRHADGDAGECRFSGKRFFFFKLGNSFA